MKTDQELFKQSHREEKHNKHKASTSKTFKETLKKTS